MPQANEMNPPKNDRKRGLENAACIVFILLLTLASISHYYAWMKCRFGVQAFRVVGPETRESYAIWEIANSHRWILISLLILFVGAYVAARINNQIYAIRISAIGSVSILVLCYSWNCIYLGGKFLNYY